MAFALKAHPQLKLWLATKIKLTSASGAVCLVQRLEDIPFDAQWGDSHQNLFQPQINFGWYRFGMNQQSYDLGFIPSRFSSVKPQYIKFIDQGRDSQAEETY